MDLTKDELCLLSNYRKLDGEHQTMMLDLSVGFLKLLRKERKESFKVVTGGDISVEGDNNTVNILVL